MTTLTKASEIAELLTTKLGEITVANGWQTDIGIQTYRGKRNIEDDEPPCAVLIEGEDRVADDSRNEAVVDCDYAVVAYLPCDPDNPNDMAHKAIKDIKKMFFGESLNMNGLVKSIKYKGRDIGARADGKPLVMAVVHVTIRFVETLTDA